MKKKVRNPKTQIVRRAGLKKLIFEWAVVVMLFFVISVNISQFVYQNHLENKMEYFKKLNVQDKRILEISSELQAERKNQLNISSSQIESLINLNFNYTGIEVSKNIFKIELQSESISDLEDIFRSLEKVGQVFLNRSDFINGTYFWSVEVKI